MFPFYYTLFFQCVTPKIVSGQKLFTPKIPFLSLHDGPAFAYQYVMTIMIMHKHKTINFNDSRALKNFTRTDSVKTEWT